MSNKGGAITELEWLKKGKELFGNDKRGWRFICPACGNVASIVMAMEKWPEVEGKGWSPYQECIGRYTDKVDCNWAAYGLFCGPLFIVTTGDNERIASFDFEGRPFTENNGKGLDCAAEHGQDEERPETQDFIPGVQD